MAATLESPFLTGRHSLGEVRDRESPKEVPNSLVALLT